MSDAMQKGSSIRLAALKGLKWSSIQQVGIQALNYASVVALAYWVDPKIHGFFAIAALAAGLAGVLGAMGIGEIIIKDTDNNFQDKVPIYWSLVLFVSVLLYIVSCIISLGVAWFYIDEFPFLEMLKTSLILSAIAPLGPIRAMMEALHSRQYDFKRISLVNLSSFIIGIIPVFILGYFDYEHMAIGAKFLLPHLSYVIIGILVYNLQFGLRWDWSIFEKIKKFSSYYSLNNVFNYFLRNIDYIILAKFFSPAILGQYVIAYKILLFPMKNITAILVRVGMPLLAKLNYSGKTFKKRYFGMVEVVASLSFPIMIFLAFNSAALVELAFNDKYDHLSQMISCLAIVGAIQSIVSPVGMLFYFKEEVRLMAVTTLLSFVIIAASILISSYTNKIFIVLLAYSGSYVVFVMPISLFFIFRKYEFSLLDSLKAFGPYLVASLAAIMFPQLLLQLRLSNLPSWLGLAINFIFFPMVYVAVLVLMDKSRIGPRFYHDYLVKYRLSK